tara:strand:+ start:534 stop:1994 length:1461 start_codon:yes stop_codon:yes gene_type:complete
VDDIQSRQWASNQQRGENFLSKAIEKHGDAFDYSKVEYKDATTKVEIRCVKHDHIFEQKPTSHLEGKVSCAHCRSERQKEIWAKKFEEVYMPHLETFKKYLDEGESVCGIGKILGWSQVMAYKFAKVNNLSSYYGKEVELDGREIQLLLDQGVSIKDISRAKGCSIYPIYNLINDSNNNIQYSKKTNQHGEKYEISKKWLEKKILEDVSVQDMADEIGCAFTVIYDRVNEYGLELPDPWGNFEEGHKFHCLTVIKSLPARSEEDGKVKKLPPVTEGAIKAKGSGRMWLCECECGNKLELSTELVNNGSYQSCGCAIQNTGENSNQWKGCGKMSGHIVAKYRGMAEKRAAKAYKKHLKKNPEDFQGAVEAMEPYQWFPDKTEKEIAEYLWSLYEDQKGKCAYTGWPIVFSPKNKAYTADSDCLTASLDRTDDEDSPFCNKGYVEGNLQWINKVVNVSKNKFGHKLFKSICEATHTNLKKCESNLTPN